MINSCCLCLGTFVLADGSYLLVVPELTALDPTPWDDEITVIWLPANFDSP